MPATILLDHDLKFLKRLQQAMKDAEDAIIRARAAMTTAALQMESAQSSMNQFMAHIGEVYGLLPQDVIMPDGHIQLVDPGWADRAAQVPTPAVEVQEEVPVPAVGVQEAPEAPISIKEEMAHLEEDLSQATPSTTSLPCH